MTGEVFLDWLRVTAPDNYNIAEVIALLRTNGFTVQPWYAERLIKCQKRRVAPPRTMTVEEFMNEAISRRVETFEAEYPDDGVALDIGNCDLQRAHRTIKLWKKMLEKGEV